MPSQLFTPIALRGLELSNRIVVAPMCQYTATDGTVGDWHIMHLGQFAVSGAGLLFVEATGVEPEGRITPGCVGLWSDENEAALKRVVDFCKRYGNVPVGIQLAHAGRKASTNLPWLGGKPLAANEGAWRTVAPSAVPFFDGWHTPEAADAAALARIQAAFVQAAQRAARIGFEALEIHSAHGYLLHQFLSPLSNVRTDGYGGGRAGRMRFSLEVAEKVRAVWPADKPLFVRISSVDSDGVTEGWQLDDSVALAGELKARGVDVVDCSSSGISGTATAAQGKQPLGFRTAYSSRIGTEADITTMVVGLVLHAAQAEKIVSNGLADLVAIGREALFDPYWARHAAYALGADPDFADWPQQYGWWLTRREPLVREFRDA